MSSADIGVIGLGAMGENLALLLAEKGNLCPNLYAYYFTGIKVSAYNRTAQKVHQTETRAKNELYDNCCNLKGFEDLGSFVSSLKVPR